MTADGAPGRGRSNGASKTSLQINDEAHHCYREKPDPEGEKLSGDEKREAEQYRKAARLWINGIEAFKRKLGMQFVFDLSATPFFLSGSGWREGTMFPWTVSDFSLIDAIECGIVKLPRVPVADNSLIPGNELPAYRDLWKHIGKDMPKIRRGKCGADSNPMNIPDKLKTALLALYKHYEDTYHNWVRAGIETPPVFIVVCNNTSTSRLVQEWISGWERPNEDGKTVFAHNGNLKLFRNYDDHGNLLDKPNTILIDSRQIESGEINDDFKKASAKAIALFKRNRKERGDHGEIADSELLREVINTVGKKNRLGEQIRCVVSVSMLTEGWDVNTVTHILGVRAFGTQLLCEQVVGRTLRRYSYELNEQNLFNVEYADIMGIPFNFTAKPQVAPPIAPKRSHRVLAMKERANLEIVFPRVTGYRICLQEERLSTKFTKNSHYTLTPEEVGPGHIPMEGVVGESVLKCVGEARHLRPSTISYILAKYILFKYFKDDDGKPKLHLFAQIKRIVRHWLIVGFSPAKGILAHGCWHLIQTFRHGPLNSFSTPLSTA